MDDWARAQLVVWGGPEPAAPGSQARVAERGSERIRERPSEPTSF